MRGENPHIFEDVVRSLNPSFDESLLKYYVDSTSSVQSTNNILSEVLECDLTNTSFFRAFQSDFSPLSMEYPENIVPLVSNPIVDSVFKPESIIQVYWPIFLDTTKNYLFLFGNSLYNISSTIVIKLYEVSTYTGSIIYLKITDIDWNSLYHYFSNNDIMINVVLVSGTLLISYSVFYCISNFVIYVVSGVNNTINLVSNVLNETTNSITSTANLITYPITSTANLITYPIRSTANLITYPIRSLNNSITNITNRLDYPNLNNTNLSLLDRYNLYLHNLLGPVTPNYSPDPDSSVRFLRMFRDRFFGLSNMNSEVVQNLNVGTRPTIKESNLLDIDEDIKPTIEESKPTEGDSENSNVLESNNILDTGSATEESKTTEENNKSSNVSATECNNTVRDNKSSNVSTTVHNNTEISDIAEDSKSVNLIDLKEDSNRTENPDTTLDIMEDLRGLNFNDSFNNSLVSLNRSLSNQYNNTSINRELPFPSINTNLRPRGSTVISPTDSFTETFQYYFNLPSPLRGSTDGPAGLSPIMNRSGDSNTIYTIRLPNSFYRNVQSPNNTVCSKTLEESTNSINSPVQSENSIHLYNSENTLQQYIPVDTLIEVPYNIANYVFDNINLINNNIYRCVQNPFYPLNVNLLPESIINRSIDPRSVNLDEKFANYVNIYRAMTSNTGLRTSEMLNNYLSYLNSNLSEYGYIMNRVSSTYLEFKIRDWMCREIHLNLELTPDQILHFFNSML